MEASVPRPSLGLGRLATRPDLTSRSTVLVTDVGCTMSRSPIFDIASSPSLEKVSSTSASYRANVSPYGLTTASTSASRIWCARMSEVMAAMDGTLPQRCFQSSSARAMGSKGRLSGFGTAPTLPAGHMVVSPVSPFGPPGFGGEQRTARRTQHPRPGDRRPHPRDLRHHPRQRYPHPLDRHQAGGEQRHRPPAQLLRHRPHEPLVQAEGV